MCENKIHVYALHFPVYSMLYGVYFPSYVYVPLSNLFLLSSVLLSCTCYCILHPISPTFFLHLRLLSPCPLPSSLPLPSSSLPQVLAQGIYDEFQSMVEMYGPESIGNLMPLVVNVLENLDSALADNQVIMQESIVCCMSI